MACSESAAGATIQDTCGRVSAWMSAAKASTRASPIANGSPFLAGSPTARMPRSYSGSPGLALTKGANQASALSSKLSSAW
ncbi:hypothetical protein VR45_36350 [Streptomyces sp. NRRL S-495]|nr:hypothetical protein VR45_36350 [Streptomyces sp. NRRL S-495]